MVYLDLVMQDDDVVVYDYRPTSTSNRSGRIRVNKHTGEKELVSMSPDGEWSEFHCKAAKKVEQMLRDDNLLEHTSVAWY